MTELSVRPFDMLLNQLGDVLDTRNLRGLVWFRRVRVFIDAGKHFRLVSAREELLGLRMTSHPEILQSRGHEKTGIFVGSDSGCDLTHPSPMQPPRAHGMPARTRGNLFPMSSNFF